MCFNKMFKKEPEYKWLYTLLNILLAIGIAAALYAIVKYIYERFFRDNFRRYEAAECYCDDDDCDCDCCDCEDDECDGDIAGNANTAPENE